LSPGSLVSIFTQGSLAREDLGLSSLSWLSIFICLESYLDDIEKVVFACIACVCVLQLVIVLGSGDAHKKDGLIVGFSQKPKLFLLAL
jgi:hypothetical protein